MNKKGINLIISLFEIMLGIWFFFFANEREKSWSFVFIGIGISGIVGVFVKNKILRFFLRLIVLITSIWLIVNK